TFERCWSLVATGGLPCSGWFQDCYKLMKRERPGTSLARRDRAHGSYLSLPDEPGGGDPGRTHRAQVSPGAVAAEADARVFIDHVLQAASRARTEFRFVGNRLCRRMRIGEVPGSTDIAIERPGA